MSKWFDSKEDLMNALQSIAYQLDSACDGVSTLELLNAARDDLYMVIDHIEEEVEEEKKLDMESIIRRNSDKHNKED